MNKYALAAAGAAIIGVILTMKQDSRPRGIRNNNPLNIEFKERNKWDGQTGSDGRFAQFVDPFYGIRAAARTMRTYRDKYGLKTVREIIHKWAPEKGKAPDGTEYKNNVEAYINSVVKRSGLFPDMYLNVSDYPGLIAAMIYHENGQQPYELALIEQATMAGFA